MPNSRSSTPRIPLSTYRLQFNSNFTFRDATALLPYLQRLGITDIYASPLLQSRHGSNHGYDATDPTRLDSDLGSEEQFAAFRVGLQRHGFGLLLDIVPNHMAASEENPWWMDVLENGPGSVYAAYFDIDWHPPSKLLDGKILLPVLGRPYGEVLESQELQIIFRHGAFLLRYFESSFPLTPKSYRRILKHREHALEDRLGADSPSFQEFLGIVSGLDALPERESLSIDAAGERRRQIDALKERLRKLYETQPQFQRFVNNNLKLFNGQRGNAASFRLLDRLLALQAYVLAYWQNADQLINYRRFFTITDLVGLRVEDPVVFDATHHAIFRLVESGAVTGFRIDHVDGLRDPVGYLRRLQESAVKTPATQFKKQKPRAIYVVVEKILSGSEQLPAEWPVQGTTGYEYLNAANRLFVYPQGSAEIAKIYRRFLARPIEYEDVLYHKKKQAMATLLAPEMRYLGRQLTILAEQDRYARDLPRTELEQSLTEVAACFPVYRTYVRALQVSAETRRDVESAIARARRHRPHFNPACFDFVRDVLLLNDSSHLFPEQREQRLAFVMRWQQFTGPIVAKGLEDAALYVYGPLLSLNEVGGDPVPSSLPTAEFSAFIKTRHRHWPHSFNATATHDTKRGEDVRARINVLSEVPATWAMHLNAWARWNAAKKRIVDGQSAPDRNEEYFLYQTLVGAWPLEESEMASFAERIQAYVIKANREAMVHTRWTLPNVGHEEALTSFVAAILRPTDDNLFLRDFLTFQRKISYYGMRNSLSQLLLKIAGPGVPDFYQGCELWDLRLVDPDNRGPVDFEKRAELLDKIEAQSRDEVSRFARELASHWQDGRVKLYLKWKALNFRRQHPRLFSEGRFLPLEVEGSRKNNVFAFARWKGNAWAIAVVPRYLADSRAPAMRQQAKTYWGDTRLALPPRAPSRWANILTDDAVEAEQCRRPALRLDALLIDFPVAFLYGARRSEAPS